MIIYNINHLKFIPMLKYSLIENLLTERPDDYTALVQPASSYDKEAVIAALLRRGTSLTRTDILAVLNGIEETVTDIIETGGTINTPLICTSFSISGVFEGPLDTFDATRHKLNINITKGTLLRDLEAKIALEKTSAVSPQPQILEVKDSVSGKVNEILTPNGVVELFGNNIKIAGDNADCGLWFVPDSGEALKAQVVIQNKPSTLIAMIPALTAGTYTLKVVTQHTGGVLLKQPKICIFDKSLVVAVS